MIRLPLRALTMMVLVGAALSCRPPAPRAAPPAPADAAPVRVEPPAIHRQVIENTELRALPRAANGRDYLLYIGLPASFGAHPERRYPVLYLCDGYWDFNLVNGIYGNLHHDEVVPEYILVGFGYPDQTTGDQDAPRTRSKPDYERLRRWDLTPAVDTAARRPDEWGHAADFLAVIEREIIPLVEAHYRGDPSYRVLGGSSLGGLFVLYAMLARPGLFAGYIAASPAVGFADDWLFRYEEAFSRSGRPLGARLFMTGADREVPKVLADIKRFNARLARRGYPDLAYQFRIIDGERHAGTKPESYNRGVRFAFAPRAPRP